MLKEQFATQCDMVTLKIEEESVAKSRKANPGTGERECVSLEENYENYVACRLQLRRFKARDVLSKYIFRMFLFCFFIYLQNW